MTQSSFLKHRIPSAVSSSCLKGETKHPRAPGPSLERVSDLILIRGIPGSGKTTMAHVLAMVGYTHFEADMYFAVDGVYCYDASRIRDAHIWCQRSTHEVLAKGGRVVVSNTFTRLHEMEPYKAMTKNLRIIEAQGRWDNVHGVPLEMLAKMVHRWEPLPDAPNANEVKQ